MPLTITRQKTAESMGCNAVTASRRLRGVPVARDRGENVYLLAAVIPRAKPADFPALFAAAKDDQELYVGSGAVTMAVASNLDAALSPEARHRYQRVRAALVGGLAGSRGGAAYLPHIETLQLKLLLHSDVLRYVVLAAPIMVDWSRFAGAWCLVNGTYEPEGVAA